MAFSHSALTVKTGGQTVVVTAYRAGSTSATVPLHLTSAVASAVTQPYAISADTTFYVPDDHAGFWVVSVKQPDGTELWGQEELLGSGEKVIAPAPTAIQLAADSQSDFRLKSGCYYLNGPTAATTTNAATVDNLRLGPVVIPNAVTLTRIGCEVTSAGGAGSVVRLGIYADDGAGYPGALVLDAGTIDGTSGTVQEIVISQQLNAGLYWFGHASQVGTACTLRVHNSPVDSVVPYTFGTSAPTANKTNGNYVQTAVTGAFPAAFTTTPVPSSFGGLARIHFKV